MTVGIISASCSCEFDANDKCMCIVSGKAQIQYAGEYYVVQSFWYNSELISEQYYHKIVEVDDPAVFDYDYTFDNTYPDASYYIISLLKYGESDFMDMQEAITPEDCVEECPDPSLSSISASNNNPDSGEQINLWAEWSGGEGHYIESHVWNFGDGTSSSVSSPWKSWTNTTGSPVTYVVNLTVMNDCGESKTRTKSITVETAQVCPTPVITSVSWTPANPMVGETVQFNGNATAGIGETITMWNWDFGDGTPVIVSNEPNPTHVYTTPAIRTFEAVVRNSCDEWSAYYTDDVNVTESMNVFVTMCKGVEEDCGAHRVEQIYGRDLFTGNDRCTWLQYWCDFACMSIPWSATNTFDLSSLSIDHEVAVAHIQAVGLMPNANYNFGIKWFDTNNTLIVNETTPYITGVSRIDEIGWLGYCASEITKNGTYRVEVDMFEDDSSIFQTVKTTFDITGVPCPTPTCTFGVI